MSYRTYINIKKYTSKIQKEKQKEEALKHLNNYIDETMDCAYFDNHEWIQKEVQFDEQIQISTTDTVMRMICGNDSYIPKGIGKTYKKKYGYDILTAYADEDIDGLRMVKVSKEDILKMVQNLCDEKANIFKKWHKQLLDIQNSNDPVSMFDLEQTFTFYENNWYATQGFFMLEKGNINTPYMLKTSLEYEMMQLIHIVNDYDWDCIDVMVQGY